MTAKIDALRAIKAAVEAAVTATLRQAVGKCVQVRKGPDVSEEEAVGALEAALAISGTTPEEKAAIVDAILAEMIAREEAR